MSEEANDLPISTIAKMLATYPEASLPDMFCAALTGIISSDAFNGPLIQSDPDACVNFALRVCRSVVLSREADQ